MQDLLETIIKTISDHYPGPVEVTPDTLLRDIQEDSLDGLELTLEMNDATDIYVTYEDYDESQTVNDLYVRLLAKREAA